MGETQVAISEPKVLIIEADSDRGRELESVLRFINYEPVLTADCGRWNDSVDEAHDILAVLVGFEVISKVPATLHTPLMSGANSIHGIVVIGGMIIAAEADDILGYTLAFVAVLFGAMNVVGGYVVTDRMLQMLKKKPTTPKADGKEA